MADEKNFVKGLFLNAPRENAPDYVIGDLGIHVERFVAWLQAQETSEKGYVKIDMFEGFKGKDGEPDKPPYLKLNTWKPGDTPSPQAQNAPVTAEADINPDDIPF